MYIYIGLFFGLLRLVKGKKIKWQNLKKKKIAKSIK